MLSHYIPTKAKDDDDADNVDGNEDEDNDIDDEDGDEKGGKKITVDWMKAEEKAQEFKMEIDALED